jgi:predicted esterase
MRLLSRFLLLTLLVVLASPGMARGQEIDLTAASPQGLTQEFQRAYQAREWERAIEVGLELAERMPENPAAAYNLACVYGLSDQAEPCAAWLLQAGRRGFWQITLARRDSDLDPARGLDVFEQALELIQKNAEEHRKDLGKAFKRRPPLITFPPDYDAQTPTPVIIALHGYGGRANGYPQRWKNAAVEFGAVLIAPQAVDRVPGAGFSWGPLDDAEILIDLTLKFAKEQCAMDEGRVILTGFSQGGYIAAALGMRYPERFYGVIPMGNPYLPQIDKPRPVVEGQETPRFFFMVGENDHLREQSERSYQDYKEAGYEAKMRVYPGVGHTFPSDNDEELRAALDWVFNEDASGE